VTENIDYQQMTAPCGLPCFECILYKASSDPETRNMVVEKLGIPYEKAACQGCRNEKGKIAHNPMACGLYPCAEEKGISFCFECDDFPCDYLHPYADQAATKPHNLKLFNLGLIKKMGLEKWATTKVQETGRVYFTEKWKL
jgi:hypothetical protein